MVDVYMFVLHELVLDLYVNETRNAEKRWNSYGKDIRIPTSGEDKNQCPSLQARPGVFGWSGLLKKSLR
jgi:hypothetical protein